MPMNQYVDTFQMSYVSGQNLSGVSTANVPIIESTAGNLQGTLGNLGNIEGASASGWVESSPIVISNAVVFSGNITANNQTIVNTNFTSGTSTAGIVVTGTLNQSGFGPAQGASIFGSGNASVSIISQNSGAFAPAGYFLINVATSGSPWVKVPFFNS